MTHQGSYQVGSFATNTQAEIRRLNAQVDLFWPVESELLLRHGLRDGMRVLDCGCGPARLLELLKRRLPNIQCTGVEIDPVLVAAGNQHFEECGLSDCRVQEGSAESPGVPEGSFDFVITRLVIEHVPDPLFALKSLRRLLKPGGRLAVISNDFDFHLRTSPPVKELDDLYNAYCASRRRDGGNPCIGRHIPHLLLQSGFRLVACEIEVAHNAMIGDAPFLKAEGGGIPAQLVQSGFLKPAVLDDMTRAWRQMLLAPTHSVARPLWVAIGEHEPGRESLEVDSTVRGSTTTEDQAESSGAAAGKARASGAALAEQLMEMVAKAAGQSTVELNDSMAALGIDSISAMMLQERVKAVTGVEVPVVHFLTDAPLKDLLAIVEAAASSGEDSVTQVVGESADGAKDLEEGEI